MKTNKRNAKKVSAPFIWSMVTGKEIRTKEEGKDGFIITLGRTAKGRSTFASAHYHTPGRKNAAVSFGYKNDAMKTQQAISFFFEGKKCIVELYNAPEHEGRTNFTLYSDNPAYAFFTGKFKAAKGSMVLNTDSHDKEYLFETPGEKALNAESLTIGYRGDLNTREKGMTFSMAHGKPGTINRVVFDVTKEKGMATLQQDLFAYMGHELETNINKRDNMNTMARYENPTSKGVEVAKFEDKKAAAPVRA